MGTGASNIGKPGAANAEENWRAIFSERLRKLREDAGQTQSQVARALGFSSESVYQLWEKADGNLPSAPNLRKLALYFGVSTDYLLGMQEPHPSAPSPGEDLLRQAKQRLFQLALQGHDYTSPEVATLYPILRRSLREPIAVCYRRVITDAMYPAAPAEVPPPSSFRTPAARQLEYEIEQLFRSRSSSRARRVKMYVLDLERVPSPRLQHIILGMQGGELIKQRQANFTLAVSNGRMSRSVLTAPNLERGDIEDVKVMPLTLGRVFSDSTAATVLVRNFAFIHGDYNVRSLPVQDTQGPQRVVASAHAIDLAFMGVGAVEDDWSQFWDWLKERGWTPAQLHQEKVIGNILYHLIREDGPLSWSVYEPPPGKEIAVDLYDPAGPDVLHALSVVVLQQLVQLGDAQIVLLANQPTRARIIRAALEMQWANTVICTLEVARKLQNLLAT